MLQKQDFGDAKSYLELRQCTLKQEHAAGLYLRKLEQGLDCSSALSKHTKHKTAMSSPFYGGEVSDMKAHNNVIAELVVFLHIGCADGFHNNALDLCRRLESRRMVPQLQALSVHLNHPWRQVFQEPGVLLYLLDGVPFAGPVHQHLREQVLALIAHWNP